MMAQGCYNPNVALASTYVLASMGQLLYPVKEKLFNIGLMGGMGGGVGGGGGGGPKGGG